MRPRWAARAVLAGLLLGATTLAGCSSGDGGGDRGVTYEGGYEQGSGGPGAGASATASVPPGDSSGSAGTSPGAGASGSATLDPDVAAQASALASAAQSAAGAVSALPGGVSVGPQQGTVIGADISWPQCPPGLGIPHKISSGQPMPRADAAFVVIGLTNGPGFHANPCLADQVAWARGRDLPVSAYSVISWPDQATVDRYGSLRKAGYAQSQFNVASMRSAGLTSPIVWLDVEPVPFYDWPADVDANALVVQGAAEGYLDAGYRIGVYSTPALWRGVVGDLTLGVPEWRAAGQTSQAEALNRCGPDWSIQGGEAVFGQWVEDRRDRNLTCPGQSAHLGDYVTRLR